MINITKDNKQEIINQCLNEAFKILNNDIAVLEETNISTTISKLPYDLWIDSAGITRNKPDPEPRLKIDTEKYDKLPIYIPKYRGEKSRILVKSVEREQSNKTKKIKKINKIYDFIYEYNDILLMCYYLDSPLFDKHGSNDNIIRDIIITLCKHDRDKALHLISKKYNIDINDIVPDKYKELANNK